jgi:hypothetical protein
MVVATPSMAGAPEPRSPAPPAPRDEVWQVVAPRRDAVGPPSVPAIDFYRSFSGELSPHQLRELLELVGFRDEGLRSAWAVVMKESRGKTGAHNDNPSTGDDSYGLFQINMIGRMGPARREQYGLDRNEDLFDPVTNAEVAFILSKGGTDFGHWGIGPNAYKGGRPRDYPEWLALYPEG